MEAFEDALERSNRSRDLTSSNYSDASFDKRSRRRGIVAPPPIRTATAEKHALAGLGERSDRWAPPPPVRPPPYSKRQRLKSRAFWQEPWFIWSIVLLVLAGLGVGIFVVIRKAKFRAFFPFILVITFTRSQTIFLLHLPMLLLLLRPSVRRAERHPRALRA